jgi:5'-deoxynucleotidase
MAENFFATISRMKYIERWALMRNSRPENLSEHSAEVAMIAHALCVIGTVRYGRELDAEKAALIGLYHDASEIITGDMPTPVKYYNEELKNAYKGVESAAEKSLLRKLPDDLRPVYEKIFSPDGGELCDRESAERERYMRRLVKAADKLSALIKCIEEENAGNSEFRTARASLQKTIDRLAGELPEVKDFVDEFLPPYGNTLDELL